MKSKKKLHAEKQWRKKSSPLVLDCCRFLVCAHAFRLKTTWLDNQTLNFYFDRVDTQVEEWKTERLAQKALCIKAVRKQTTLLARSRYFFYFFIRYSGVGFSAILLCSTDLLAFDFRTSLFWRRRNFFLFAFVFIGCSSYRPFVSAIKVHQIANFDEFRNFNAFRHSDKFNPALETIKSQKRSEKCSQWITTSLPAAMLIAFRSRQLS